MNNPQRYDVLVVGAGFAGLYAIYRFRKLGLHVRVFEKAPEVGGTWFYNRYPGCRCDVPSIEYSYGFSDELDQEWNWPEVFSAQGEILEYAKHVADKFDLRRDIAFNTLVTSATFDDDSKEWVLTTNKGESFVAPYCVMAAGGLSVPNKPPIPGVESFGGLQLHTGDWPQEPVDFSGKRVAVIGTGSSGVQTIPEIADKCGELYVLQRTATYTFPAFGGAMTEEWTKATKSIYPLLRERRKYNFRGVSNFSPFLGQKAEEFANKGVDEDTGGFRGTTGGNLLDIPAEERRKFATKENVIQLLNFEDVYLDPAANAVASDLYRDYVRSVVDDPETAEGLIPHDYGIFCKRPILDRNYFETFNRDNVHLVNLRAEPIEAFNEKGVKTSKRQIDLDVVIYATGFDAMTGALLACNITGANGLRLADKWSGGPLNYLGLAIAGFPNLFMVTGPGSPAVLANMINGIEQHIDWIGDCIEHMRDQGLERIEVDPSAEAMWVKHVNEVAGPTSYNAPTCRSWYHGDNIEGKPRFFLPYIGGFHRYREKCDEVAETDYEGFIVA